MTSVEQAAVFFQRHGFRAVVMEEQRGRTTLKHLAVGIPGDFESDAESALLPMCWGKQAIVVDDSGWVATAMKAVGRDGPLQRARFGSLVDTVNDVLARLQHCLRTDTSFDRM
jgi:hypothetical protein